MLQYNTCYHVYTQRSLCPRKEGSFLQSLCHCSSSPLTCMIAMHFNVRLPPRELATTMVSRHHSIGKQRCGRRAHILLHPFISSSKMPFMPRRLHLILSTSFRFLNIHSPPANFAVTRHRQGLQSFMTEDSDAVGSIRCSASQRTALALDSLNFNLRDKSDFSQPLRCLSTHSHSAQVVCISLCRTHSTVAPAAGGASEENR